MASVDSSVVCSTVIGNARASMRGIDNGRISRSFLCLIVFLHTTKMTESILANEPQKKFYNCLICNDMRLSRIRRVCPN